MRADGALVTTLKQQRYTTPSRSINTRGAGAHKARHGWVFDFWETYIGSTTLRYSSLRPADDRTEPVDAAA